MYVFALTGYLTDYLAEEAAVAIEHNKENPFLLFLSLTAVHTPLTAKKKDYDSLSHIQVRYNIILQGTLLPTTIHMTKTAYNPKHIAMQASTHIH